MAKKKPVGKAKIKIEKEPHGIERKDSAKPVDYAFGKQNYLLIGIAFLLVIVGFVLMIGDENIYDFRKIWLAPIVVMAGFIFGIYAIMKKTPKEEEVREND